MLIFNEMLWIHWRLDPAKDWLIFNAYSDAQVFRKDLLPSIQYSYWGRKVVRRPLIRAKSGCYHQRWL